MPMRRAAVLDRRPTSAGLGGELSAQLSDLVLQLDDPLRAGQGHALAHQRGEGGDVAELDSAVAPLPADGAGRAHDAFGVEAADERWLHVQHRCGLADREERGSGIGHVDGPVGPARTSTAPPRPWRLTTRRRRQARCDASCELASIEVGCPPPHGDVDAAGLGLLLHRHPQPQHAVGVVGGDPLAVQRLSQEQLPAERARRAFADQQLDVVVARDGCARRAPSTRCARRSG